jgi:hypothetical protein
MYKPNKRHLQPLLISNVNELQEKKRKRLVNSWAEDFYQHFFSRINEEAFAVLYVDHPYRPNVPINWLVSLETLKACFGWSDEELYDHFCFDLKVRYALGIHDLNESDFELRTLYYFRERLSRYNLEHGVNLLTQAFEQITDQQLTTLQVKTGKQPASSCAKCKVACRCDRSPYGMRNMAVPPFCWRRQTFLRTRSSACAPTCACSAHPDPTKAGDAIQCMAPSSYSKIPPPGGNQPSIWKCRMPI